MKPECGNKGCSREAGFERDLEFNGRTVVQLRCEPCKELHAYRAQFRPIREAVEV